MAYLLGCENVSLEFPTKRVFDGLTLGVDDGDRIGVVGGNGDGKSTLLALLAGSVEPDEGRVMSRRGTSVLTLQQSDSLDPESTVGHAVVGDVPEYTWASDARVRSIIRGLIADVSWSGRVGELSGGQRRRVDLARVLVRDSDVLMLDEPTNHLDVHAISWLAEHLKSRWPKKTGALLVVTHDRWFLDEVCTRMWEVHSGRVERFSGGYSAYVLQRVEREQAARTAEQKRRNVLRKELAWLSRGAQARSTKPKFRVDAACALIADEPPVRNALELKRTALSRLGRQVVDLEHVTHSFGTDTVLDDVTWHIGPGDRFGIVGENGSGKTTLLRLIQGALPATRGTVRIGKTVRFAVLSQHLDELEDAAGIRVRELLARHKTRYEFDGKELTPSQLLERLGFESAHLSARVSDLSGGQRRRLQLMLILLEQPNVLILDEPDNDLDIDMLAVVESLLDTWPGTLLLITHDRHLMERVTDHQFAILDGRIRHLPGGVDEYLRLLEDREDVGDVGPTGDPRRSIDGIEATPDESRSEVAPALSRSEEYVLKKQLASTERKLETMNRKAEAARQNAKTVDPSDYVALVDAAAQVAAIEHDVAELEDEWLRLSERLS